jgi:radical SAM protein with 4Fe4S-binding SPASM domain
MIKTYLDKKYNFKEIFDTRTGMYVRSGVLDENGKDTNVDPFMRSFPGLIDIGVMSSCTHGRTGLCAKAGIQCYQNGLNQFGPNMTLENYKRIIDEGEKNGLFQVALGGRGDPDMHENFEDIIRYSAEHHITPNFTTSGLGMTPEKAAICKKYCGAVACSQYSRIADIIPDLAFRKLPEGTKKVYRGIDDIPAVWTFGDTNPNCYFDGPNYVINGESYGWDELHHMVYSDEPQEYEYFRVYNEKRIEGVPNYTYNAIKMLLDAGVKTNIHFVLGNNTIDEAITRLRYGGFPKGINAVIFLLHKPVGLGKEDNVLQAGDPKVAEFFSLIDEGRFAFKIGFDSCTVPAILNYTKNIAPESIDSCEGGRYSMYITADMKALPCSFDNQEMKWAYDISHDSILNAWNSEQFNDFRSHFINSCPDCPNKTSCYGGCPIRRSTVVCARDTKKLK